MVSFMFTKKDFVRFLIIILCLSTFVLTGCDDSISYDETFDVYPSVVYLPIYEDLDSNICDFVSYTQDIVKYGEFDVAEWYETCQDADPSGDLLCGGISSAGTFCSPSTFDHIDMNNECYNGDGGLDSTKLRTLMNNAFFIKTAHGCVNPYNVDYNTFCLPYVKDVSNDNKGILCIPQLEDAGSSNKINLRQGGWAQVTFNDVSNIKFKLTVGDNIKVTYHAHYPGGDAAYNQTCSRGRGPRLDFEDATKPDCNVNPITNAAYNDTECNIVGVDDDCDGLIDERPLKYDFSVFTDEGVCQKGINIEDCENPYYPEEDDLVLEEKGTGNSNPRVYIDYSGPTFNGDYNQDGSVDYNDLLYALDVCGTNSNDVEYQSPFFPTRENYDLVDNDCDGYVDEDLDIDNDGILNKGVKQLQIPSNTVVCYDSYNLSMYNDSDIPGILCNSLDNSYECSNEYFKEFCKSKGMTFDSQTISNSFTQAPTYFFTQSNKIVLYNTISGQKKFESYSVSAEKLATDGLNYLKSICTDHGNIYEGSHGFGQKQTVSSLYNDYPSYVSAADAGKVFCEHKTCHSSSCCTGGDPIYDEDGIQTGTTECHSSSCCTSTYSESSYSVGFGGTPDGYAYNHYILGPIVNNNDEIVIGHTFTGSVPYGLKNINPELTILNTDRILCSDGTNLHPFKSPIYGECASANYDPDCYRSYFYQQFCKNENLAYVGQTVKDIAYGSNYINVNNFDTTLSTGDPSINFDDTIYDSTNDICDGFDNDVDGIIDEGTSSTSFSACSYNTNVLFMDDENGKNFYVCGDDSGRYNSIVNYIKTDSSLGNGDFVSVGSPNVLADGDSCEIKGNYYCSEQENWKSIYRFNDKRASAYGGAIVDTVRESLDGTTNYCCPKDWCGLNDSLNCVRNVTNEYNNLMDIYYTDDGESWRCSKGDWVVAKKSYDWYHVNHGFCHDYESQCFIGENTIIDKTQASDVYGKNICMNDTGFVYDHYCDSGNWTSRTRDIALQMVEYALDQNFTEYSISCGDGNLVLNDISYLEPLDDCGSAANPYDCVNDFCVMQILNNGDEFVLLGTSLNVNLTEPVGSGEVFTKYIGKDSSYCSNVLSISNPENKYYSCSNIGDVYYNPHTESMIFSKNIINNFGSYTSTWAEVYNTVTHPIRSFANLINKLLSAFNGEDLSLEKEQDVSFLENLADFNGLFMKNSPDIHIYAIEELQFAYDGYYFGYTIEYSGVDQDMCAFINEYNQYTGYKFDCIDQGSSVYDIYYKSVNPLPVWDDMTSKLRIS